MICKENINGILKPNLMFPFYVHHNKYKARKAYIPVPKNPTFAFSIPVRILFKNGLAAVPFDVFIAIYNKL